MKHPIYEIQCRHEYNWTTIVATSSKSVAIKEAKKRANLFVECEFRVIPIDPVWETKK